MAQRHVVELACRGAFLGALRERYPKWSRRLGDDHVLDLGLIKDLGDTALTGDGEIAMGDNGLPTTFVPGRNILFLTVAAAIAYRRGLRVLVGGMCETDYSGYPDCRDDTLKALQVALNLGMDKRFVDRDAADVARQGGDVEARGIARRRRIRRVDHRAHAHLLPGRPHAAACLGLWLRNVPGVPVASRGYAAYRAGATASAA